MRASRRSALSAVALGALALGCASRGPAPRGERNAIDVAAYARLLQMADARRLDTAFVRAELRARSSAERAAAALAIGQVHGTAMAADLRALLADRDTAVAANAAFALGLLHDTASVLALAHALDAPPGVAAAAAWSLGEIGAPARDAVLQALSNGARPVPVRGALLLAAAKLRPVPAAAVTPLLVDPSPEVRWRAAYVFARSYAPAGVRTLLPIAGDTSALVRAQVARALSAAAAGDSLAAQARPALVQLAHDPAPHVRVNAVRALATYGADARAPVLAAIRDSDANVRVEAARNLGRVLDATRATWMQAWNADTSFAYRAAILASAMHVDVVLPAAEFEDPDSWSHVGDWRYRAAVAEAGAAATSMERMREVSLPAVRDPDPRVREAAYAAMAPHADTAEHHPWRRELMYVGLHDWDPYVRALSIESLTHHATAAEVPRVLASYRFAARDSVDDARLAAIRFFVSAWRRDSANFADSVTAALRALPAPADPRLRAAGDTVSLFAAWRNAPRGADTPPHPLAWYEERVRTLVLPALAGHLPHAELRT
ncbi:MAG: HEAT repeat domain-containing protein, partial [Gemmatimonadaceae bacterium]|nr:HEAT repeat domain-containing protein [Gemmatimonadaceae bacterium]